MKIFDTHIHIQPWKMVKPKALALLQDKRVNVARLTQMMDDPDELIKFMDEEGIDRVCTVNYVSPNIMGFTEEVNRYAGEYARKYPHRIFPYGSVHPLISKKPADDMERLFYEYNIRGIKLHPPHQTFYPNAYRHGLKALEVIYQKAQEYKMPVMFHTGTSIFPNARNAYADPIYIDDVAIDFPELKIVLAHGGRPLWMQTCVFLLRRFKNVFMDVSSIPPKNLLDYFPKLETIADKVLWGTDWPAPGVPGMKANVEKFKALPLSQDAKEKILYKNALVFFGS